MPVAKTTGSMAAASWAAAPTIAMRMSMKITPAIGTFVTTVVSGEDPVSIAMKEIEDGTLGFVKDDFDEAIKGANKSVF